MFLARIINGRPPTVTEVSNYEWRFEWVDGGERMVKVPRQAWARRIKGGAAALSQTPHGAIASAKVILEEQLMKQHGKTTKAKVNA